MFFATTASVSVAASGTFELYEDEGDNYNYERGEYSIIKFVWNDKAQQLAIQQRNGSFKGMLQNRTFKVIRVDNGKSTDVQYNGEEISVKI